MLGFLALLLLAAAIIAVIELGLVEYVHARMGIGRRAIFAMLLLSLLGSYVNIPVARFPGEQVVSDRLVWVWGVPHVVPMVSQWPGTVLAVNLGGAVVPLLVSIYLIFRNRIYLEALVGTAIVAAVVHSIARPEQGVGITMPIFIAPFAAAGIALLLSRRSAPAVAYSIGSLGTLIGADLLNLGSIQGLGAPVASIGGAGTFDGIFVTGLLAVLLA